MEGESVQAHSQPGVYQGAECWSGISVTIPKARARIN